MNAEKRRERKKQTDRVMPLVGPLIDSFNNLDNASSEELEACAPMVFKYLTEINEAIENDEAALRAENGRLLGVADLQAKELQALGEELKRLNELRDSDLLFVTKYNIATICNNEHKAKIIELEAELAAGYAQGRADMHKLVMEVWYAPATHPDQRHISERLKELI